jgi:hypothetical protein
MGRGLCDSGLKGRWLLQAYFFMSMRVVVSKLSGVLLLNSINIDQFYSVNYRSLSIEMFPSSAATSLFLGLSESFVHCCGQTVPPFLDLQWPFQTIIIKNGRIHT